jgi:hypothetical protein
MFYLLLALPHVVGMAALLAIAYRTSSGGSADEGDGGIDDGGGRGDPPPEPTPRPSGGGLPLEHADPPRRRLRVGERLAELYPRRLRRDHAPAPQRAPVPDRESA